MISYIVRSKSTHFWGSVCTSFPIHHAYTARQHARQKYTALHENNDLIFHVKASKYQLFDAQVCAQSLTVMKKNITVFANTTNPPPWWNRRVTRTPKLHQIWQNFPGGSAPRPPFIIEFHILPPIKTKIFQKKKKMKIFGTTYEKLKTSSENEQF